MTISDEIKDREHKKFVDDSSNPAVRVIDSVANALVPSRYDYVALSNYSGSNPQTIVFKNGGALGATVATLTLTYSGDNLTSVTKS